MPRQCIAKRGISQLCIESLNGKRPESAKKEHSRWTPSGADPLWQPDQIKAPLRARINGVGAGKIPAGIKMIGQHWRPLRKRESEVGRGQDIIGRAGSSV